VVAGVGAERVVAELTSSGEVEARVLDPAAARRALLRGDVALLVVPDATGVTFRYDPTREESRLARLAAADALQRAAGREDVRRVREERVEERGSRYIDFLIPGLIGLNLLGTGLWGVGHALVRMRRGKLLERLQATPMRRSDFLASFILARLAFLVAELAALLLFARYVFDVPVRGSLAALLAAAALGALAFTGLGLLVASRIRTEEAVMGVINLVSVPMWILSGVFFSAAYFPDAIQPLVRVLPLTAAVDALRAIMLEGASLAAVAPALGILTAWGAASFGGALALFRWR